MRRFRLAICCGGLVLASCANQTPRTTGGLDLPLRPSQYPGTLVYRAPDIPPGKYKSIFVDDAAIYRAADADFGGASEAALCAEKFDREGVGVSLTVTPCWCYGSETMDMDPLRPKAIWGFNGTDRPGAVYLAATLSAHAQKGFPCFGIYGRDVQDLGDASIPVDVREKILRFAKAGIAVATMRGG